MTGELKGHLNGSEEFIFELRARQGLLEVSLANGGSGSAFVAHVGFRDKRGALIRPPYSGFDLSETGLGAVPLVGGAGARPGTTRFSFVAPEGARYLTLEIRDTGVGEQPRLLRPPQVLGDDLAGFGSEFRLPMGPDVTGISLQVANGSEAGGRAFAAKVAFLDVRGREVTPSAGSFARSQVLGPFFYVGGGSVDSPVTTVQRFLPPSGAAQLKLELVPWAAKTEILLKDLPHVERRESTQEGVVTSAYRESQGARIADHVKDSRVIAAGIFGEGLRVQLAEHGRILDAPFDSYDSGWRLTPPTHLVVEVDQLSARRGWRHALTLRDAQASVELATMVERARALGAICILLLSQEHGYRFPLVSKIASVFHHVVDDSSAVVRLVGERLS